MKSITAQALAVAMSLSTGANAITLGEQTANPAVVRMAMTSKQVEKRQEVETATQFGNVGCHRYSEW